MNILTKSSSPIIHVASPAIKVNQFNVKRVVRNRLTPLRLDFLTVIKQLIVN